MNCKVLSARSNCRSLALGVPCGTPPAAFMSAAQLTPSASPVSMNGRIAPITGNTTPSARAASPFSANSSETTSIVRIAKCARQGDRRAGGQNARVLRMSKQRKIQGLLAQIDRAGAGHRTVAGLEHQGSGRHDAVLDLEPAHQTLNGHHAQFLFLAARREHREDLADIQPERLDDQRIDLPAAHDHGELAIGRGGHVADRVALDRELGPAAERTDALLFHLDRADVDLECGQQLVELDVAQGQIEVTVQHAAWGIRGRRGFRACRRPDRHVPGQPLCARLGA